MNVIYVRSYPSQPQELDEGSLNGSGIGDGSIQAAARESRTTKRRKWRVSLRVNDHAPTSTFMEDPFLEVEYRTIFEQYLRSSDRPRWSMYSLTADEYGWDDITRAEDMIQAYGETLFSQLELKTGMFGSGVPEAQIYVVEHHDNYQTNQAAGGIHCLAWELLESVQVARLPKLRLRVTRVSDFPALRYLRPPKPSFQKLAAVQADPNAVFKILLVIARDFSRTGAERDPEPDLAQWPLMNLQKKLRSRLTLEVVRPGSLEELERHLELRASQSVEFNLVHFDLHGRIMRDE